MNTRKRTLKKIIFKALGTDISIQIISDNVDNSLENEIKNFYREKEKIFSRFNKNSELSQLNKKLGVYNDASSDIIRVAEKCLKYYDETEKYFDPRIIEILENIGYDRDFKNISPKASSGVAIKLLQNNLKDDLRVDGDKIYLGHRMDFSGIAKGYITDKLADFLQEKGYNNFLIDSGGDIRISGKNEDRENWKISLEGIEDELLLELNSDFPAAATSGITRRKWENKNGKFHHLINPHDPEKFNFDLKSVTVVAKTCEEADVWAKVLFLLGKEKGLKFSQERSIRSVFLDYRGSACISEDIKNNIVK